MISGPLGILAGGGRLPAMIAEAVIGAGREVVIVAFHGQTDPAVVAPFRTHWNRMGAAGAVMDWLRGEGVRDLVFAGPVTRPSLGQLAPDWRAAKILARVGARALGDDGLLRLVAQELERDGFRVVALQELLRDLLTPEGVIGSVTPDEIAAVDVARGVAVARGLGALDVGQGAVVQQGMVLAVEAIEGTDSMLSRCRGLARPGPGGVLVKMRKPQQDRRLDLPTIGVSTVEGAAAAGLRGIAVEAGGSLTIDRPAVAARADALGLFVIGVKPPVSDDDR